MNKDLISIILPVYNAERTISSTIESMLSQTYKNFELIIINDGSSDSSDNICQKFQKADKRIKYIYRVNKGVSKTRNEGISLSKGKYLMFIDADDKYKNNMLKTMLEKVQKCDMAICCYERVNEKNRKITNVDFSKRSFNSNEFGTMIEILQHKKLFNQVWNKIFIKNKILDNNLKFNENISLGEDLEFVLDYLKHCSNVVTIPERLYEYLNTTDGLNRRYRSDRIRSKLSNAEKIIEFYEINGYDLKYSQIFYVKTCASILKDFKLIKDSQVRKNEIIEFRKTLNVDGKLKKILSQTKNLKLKILCKFLLCKSIIFNCFLINILSFYDFINKKKIGY